MSHMDEPDSDDVDTGAGAAAMDVDQTAPKKFENQTPENSVYQLQSTITHLGSGLGSGHYVCHTRFKEDATKWIYFNDDKVAVMDDPPIGKGYMYFLR